MKLPDYTKAKMRKDKNDNVISYNIDKSLVDKYKGKKFFLKTYGCQMNEHDSENLRAMLLELGFSESDHYEDSDLILLNTCSIRENAHNKAFGMLGRVKHLKETKKDLIVGICGCMAQEKVVVDKILDKYKYVNFVIGTHNMDHLPYIVDKAINTGLQEVEVYSEELDLVEDIPLKRDTTYKAYVNIIYGCDKFCTYCIVPFTRGRQRSRKKEYILDEIRKLIKDGYKEVTLLGQNVNAYGKDLYDDYSFSDLLRDVAETKIERVRFVTSHPWDFTDEMIDVISKYPNIMPSVHLPVQSGSSRILKLMGRRYTKEEYLELFNKLKNKVKNIAISTDIIVGFPGEEEKDFLETLSLVDECKFDNAFTFIYSKREGTAACKLLDNTPIEEKEERLQRLNNLVNKYFLENNKKLVGKIEKVLVEGSSKKENHYFGYTEGNKLVNFTGNNIEVGSIVSVKIVDAKTWSLDGEVDG